MSPLLKQIPVSCIPDDMGQNLEWWKTSMALNTDIPLNPKHFAEGEAAGLRLISRDHNDPNSMIYKCLNCSEYIL